MVKRTVEIDDTLEETVECVKYDLRHDFIDYLKENPEIEDFDEYYKDSDMIHEIVDSAVPIYYSEIDGLYYLYGDEFEEAYQNAGIGDGTEDNHRQVTIYCYLEEQAFDYLRELEDLFDEFVDEKNGIKKLIKELEEEN